MTRFFRQNRKEQLSEHNFIKYLRYALGEFIIVVLGILFALYINNLNEQRQANDRTIENLKEVQNDLVKDIQNVDATISYYKRKESTIKLILNGKLPDNYYKNNPAGSKYLIMAAHHIKLYDNGYKNLMQNSNDMPDKYKAIINPLYEIFVYNKYEIDQFDNRMNEITNQYDDILMKKFDWYYSEFSSTSISDRMIDYFSTPEYKNLAYRYGLASWTALSSNLSHFRYNAVNAYLKIAKLIDNENEIPKYVDHNFIKIDSTILKQYTGTYKLVSVANYIPSNVASKIKISMKGNHLLVSNASDSSGTGTDIYFRSIDECYNNSRPIIEYYFTRNNDGSVSGETGKLYFTLTNGYPRQFKKIN